MKLMILAGGVGLLGLAAYGVGNYLSPDAVALLLGVIFGIVGSVSMPLLLLLVRLSERRTQPPPYSQPPRVEVLPPVRQLPPPTTITVGRGAYRDVPREQAQDRCKRLEARRRRTG